MNGWKMLIAWTLCALLIALVAGWPTVVNWTNANSGLASWVQAVFSVLAISATAGVVFWQHDLERGRQKEVDVETRKRRHAVVVALAHTSLTQAKWLRTKMPDRATVVEIHDKTIYFEMDDIARLGLHITSVPLHEFDDPVMLRDFVILMEHCRELRSLLAFGVSAARTLNTTSAAQLFEAFDNHIGHCKTSFENLKARADQIAAGTHATPIF
ncbi:hypothetical protein [Variovorax paradoxus]|uniref:hypothetical protein n=1 Tax=Variovorax paradoxus TaxID=34073 RepID=UPI001186775B|nr:hypothetical protein [Variovorax paradoxus]